METFITLVAAGIAQGGIYTLVALGLVITYKASGIINFSQGALVAMGAFLGYWLISDLGWNWLTAYAVVTIGMFLFSGALARVAIEPIRRRVQVMVMVSTFALSLIIEALLRLWRGTNPISLPSPVGNGVLHLGPVRVPAQVVLVVAVAAVLVGLIVLVFTSTSIGRQVRALAADRTAARLAGVRTVAMSFLVFGAAGAVAALGGLLVAPLTGMSTSLGFSIMLTAFAAAVIGGFDRLSGVVLAAMVLAIGQALASGYLSATFNEAYPFLIMLVVLLFRPRGLFAAVERTRF